MAKFLKKGKNPGAVDCWLESLGLYRKNVAYDETCLFRAASEQLFECQIFHERVRRECIDYARENYAEFTHLISSEKKWNEHLDSLAKHMVVCGNTEIELISRKYQCNVIVFEAGEQKIIDVTPKQKYKKTLLLCLLDKDHYDVIYKKEHIVNAGFCQSIVYKILYEEVFNVKNVDDIVNAMLYEKTNVITHADLACKTPEDIFNNNAKYGEEVMSDSLQIADQQIIAPFPFKVAKALDPTIYRNIEYDSWGEVRRELRLGEWYYGDDKLILGTKCIYNDPYTYEQHECYIQEIINDSNQCIVYLVKDAQKKTVSYKDLSPEDEAKPWPLPYRFYKNMSLNPALQPQPPVEKKIMKKIKNKERRRTRSCGESTPVLNNGISNLEIGDNIHAFVGVPLHIQNGSNNCNRNFNTVSQEAVQTETENVHSNADYLLTPATSDSQNIAYQNRYVSWDYQQQYSPYAVTHQNNPFIWPQPSQTPQNSINYNIKPMVASAPVTPSIIPYHDTSYPYFWSYPVDSSYQWPKHDEFQNQQQQTRDTYDKPSENLITMQEPVSPSRPVYADNSTQHTPERFHLSTNLTPQQSQESFSPTVIPMTPTTPVIYTPAPTELVIPTSPVMYTPPVDVHYVSPFIYPPTPPAMWYPSGVTPQGFIFPTPMNQAVQK